MKQKAVAKINKPPYLKICNLDYPIIVSVERDSDEHDWVITDELMSLLVQQSQGVSKQEADYFSDTTKDRVRGWPLILSCGYFEIVPGTDLPEPPKTDRADYTPIIATAVALAVLLAVSAYRIFF